MLRNGNKYILMLVSIIMLTACISQSRTSFIPPQDRESLLAEQPWPHNGFVAISWHNVEDEAADQRFMSVRTSALREQFARLRENGYQPVSIAQIREAHRGGKPLPEKAVVLTFDDGYQSFFIPASSQFFRPSSGLLYGPPSAVGSIRQRMNK